MQTISEEYRELNRRLHEERPDYGNGHLGWGRWVVELVKNNAYLTILDYGCGKGSLGKLLGAHGISISEYDPAIPGKDGDPQPAELVVCTDVLEHIEPENLNSVLRHLRELTQRRLFVTVFTKPSGKVLEDGRNAHLIQESGLWWREKLRKYFQILIWEEKGPLIAAELVAKNHMGIRKANHRRHMPEPMVKFFEGLKANINAASDAISQIKTIRMYEGFDDAPADLQGAHGIMEYLDDIDLGMGDLACNSLKCTFCAVKISGLHSEWDWTRVIDKRFRVAKYELAGDNLMAIGAPGVRVQGVTAVGAVNSEERWQQVKTATERFAKRIETAEAHGRTAVIVCYGPSLADTIEQIRVEAQRPDVDVISVSGAHDFLLSHGIVPRYHIECDPRPHKSDNIDQFRPDVTYLIASVVHPRYFDKMGDVDVRLWHVSDQESALRLINELKENPRHAISGGGSVGLRSIPLLYAMGYRNLSIFAMDCSFKVDGEDVKQWAGRHAGKRQDVCEVMCDGEVFASSPVLLTYATNFFETTQKVEDLNVRLYGHGLLQAMAAYYMRCEESPEFIRQIENAA